MSEETIIHQQNINFLTFTFVLDMVEFTDEESYGRFLDLHECYLKYINLKGLDRITYVSYLDDFDKLADIPKTIKNSFYKE